MPYISENACLDIRKALVATKPADLDSKWFLDQFEPLLESAVESPGLGTHKTSAADSLSVWLQRSIQWIGVDARNADKVGPIVTNERATTVFSFVCDFWTDSGAALGNALRDLFTKIIILLSKLRAKKELTSLLQGWTDRVLQFPKTMRVLYVTTEILSKHVGGSYILSVDPSFLETTLPLIGSDSLANPIGRALFSIYQSIFLEIKATEDHITSWTHMWSAHTVETFIQIESTRTHMLSYFLPHMFKFCPASLHVFVEPLRQRLDSESHLSLLIGALKVGQDLAITDLDSSLIDTKLLTSLLHHSSAPLRISGMSLLVSSPKGSKPVPAYVFAALEESMDDLLSESDAGLRYQVHGLLRQFFFRIRNYSYATSRKAEKLRSKLAHHLNNGSTTHNDDLTVIKQYESVVQEVLDFCMWFLRYIQDLMRPGSPYHSMFSGLSMLKLLVQSGIDSSVDSKYFEKGYIPYPFSVAVYDRPTVRLLVNCVASNYEDIRVTSASILRMAAMPIAGFTNDEDLEVLKAKAASLLSGMRGREGDTGARIAELVYYLSGDNRSEYLHSLVSHVEAQVKNASKDLASAVHKDCIHGSFTCLRYILEEGNKITPAVADTALIERIVNCILGIWEVVKDILCHDSPEGNMPEELESIYNQDLEEKYGPASQVILSYSWRAVKESTALLKCLLDNCSPDLLSNNQVVKSGEVVLTQLATVRHRGAFSSVYPTFVACCVQCNLRPELVDVSSNWLTENLKLIQLHSQYITRRSGGLPFLITAVLTADIDPQSSLLSETFDKLLRIAQEPVVASAEEKMDLPQVHAFNCIKALFIEAELSTRSAVLVDKALDLAISSFSSEVWAIRNCAVMLFTALQNRLFGAKTESKVSARLFFTRYHGVRPVLLNNLKEHVRFLDTTEQSSQHVETVFPVLSLLARIEGVNGYDGLDEFRPLILSCLGSRIWKIREMAARVLASIITSDEACSFAEALLANAAVSTAHQNILHGVLMFLIELYQKAGEELKADHELTQFLVSMTDEWFLSNGCPETAVAFARVVSLLCPQAIQDLLVNAASIDDVVRPKTVGMSSASRVLRAEIAKVWLNMTQSTQDFSRVCRVLLFDSSYEVQLITIEFLDGSVESCRGAQGKAIVDSLWELFTTGDWDTVRGPAVCVFSRIVALEKGSLLTDVGKYWDLLYESAVSDSTEEILESALETLGPLTARSDNTTAQNRWMSLVDKYSAENMEFPQREAALLSVAGYLQVVTSDADCLPVYMRLFNFLTDDDVDLRAAATELVSERLNLGSITSSYAEDRLFDHILRHTSCTLPKVLDMVLGGPLPNISKMLDRAMQTDQVLFSVEKQNLFRNELSRMDLWGRKLDKFSDCFTAGERQSFAQWAHHGVLDVEKVIKTMGYDGILGWTSDADLFGVLYLVKTAVSLADKWEPTRLSLRELQEANDIHELLRVTGM